MAVVYVIGPWLEAPGLRGLEAAVTLAYPIADILILALIGAVVAVVGLRADRLLVLTCVVLANKAVGDLLLTAEQADGGYVPGGPLDLLWIGNAVLITAAAVYLPGPVRLRAADATGTGWRAVSCRSPAPGPPWSSWAWSGGTSGSAWASCAPSGASSLRWPAPRSPCPSCGRCTTPAAWPRRTS